MGLADRVYNLAKAYVDKASQRWEEIDENAKQELDRYPSQPEQSAWDRAQAKIDQASATPSPAVARPAMRDTLNDLPPGYEPPIPQVSPQPGTVDAAYRVLGVASGASFEDVRKAYDKVRERANRVQFPNGSPEQEKAKAIERRASAAYMLLTDALKPADDRFDRLEI